ncbi:MAG: 3'-5' exonuclease [Verrucomicrobiota bacterium]
MNIPVTISKEELHKLPLFSFQGTTHLPQSLSELNQAAETLSQEKVIGFDIETRPSFKKGQHFKPSLVQLSTEENAYLFQLRRLETVSPVLQILEAATPLKTGIALDRDIKDLQEFIPFQPKGFLELGNIARQSGMEKTGLRNLCGMLLGHRISKKAQTSNWARKELTNEQISYAATDAWVSLKLYQRLRYHRPDLFKEA